MVRAHLGLARNKRLHVVAKHGLRLSGSLGPLAEARLANGEVSVLDRIATTEVSDQHIAV